MWFFLLLSLICNGYCTNPPKRKKTTDADHCYDTSSSFTAIAYSWSQNAHLRRTLKNPEKECSIFLSIIKDLTEQSSCHCVMCNICLVNYDEERRSCTVILLFLVCIRFPNWVTIHMIAWCAYLKSDNTDKGL